MERAMEYLLTISVLARHRIKFGDEKHLKGSKFYGCKSRTNVLTGEVHPISTQPDFGNTYSIVGFCGINDHSISVRYGITQDINDSENFAIQIELVVIAGFLLPYDILVCGIMLRSIWAAKIRSRRIGSETTFESLCFFAREVLRV
ncbi:hypothetical protein ACHAWF_007370 [Thalassiosira exigua]